MEEKQTVGAVMSLGGGCHFEDFIWENRILGGVVKWTVLVSSHQEIKRHRVKPKIKVWAIIPELS